jgi:exosome complex exonuclease DIS3/RRP44
VTCIEDLVKRDTKFDAGDYTITVTSSLSFMDQKTTAVFDKVRVLIEVEKDKKPQRG